MPIKEHFRHIKVRAYVLLQGKIQFALSEEKGGGGQAARISHASPAFGSSKGSYSWRRNAMMLVLISPKAVSLLDPRRQCGEAHPFQHDNEQANLTSK